MNHSHFAITMEIQTLPKDENDDHSSVDTSRPFRSVKEAVAIFGERFLPGEIYSPKPFTFPKPETPWVNDDSFPPSPPPFQKPKEKGDSALVDTLKKLETELRETKMELKLLKERESETEVALASLNAELHKNMSKIAAAEAEAAGKALASRSLALRGKGEDSLREDQTRKDVIGRMSASTLAQILNIAEKDKRGKKMMVMKKKPIIPLVGDFFSRKKESPTTLNNPLYVNSTSHMDYFK